MLDFAMPGLGRVFGLDQDHLQEFVVDVLAVPDAGRVRLFSGKRYLNLRAADLNAYEGERGRRGSKLPRGFQRVDGIELDN